MKTLSETLKPSKQYILCDYASEEWGTGDCITAIKDALISSSFTVTLCEVPDISVYKFKDASVAVIDYVEIYDENRKTKILQIFNDDFNPDIIVCNSLSWGNSLESVEKLAEDNDCKLILFRNFRNKSSNIEDLTACLNRINGKSIVEIIKSLLNIKDDDIESNKQFEQQRTRIQQIIKNTEKIN
ncbi:MAG: hypothetical protein MJ009_07280 [Paludibacteraceae bacterium]|nr:hypothetical protein [Paludibacteraceae bacterium]